jgi:hypothetical protein
MRKAFEFINSTLLLEDTSEIHWSEYVIFYGFYTFVFTVFAFTMITIR